MKGNITRRGKNSFRLKFDSGIDANGKRKIQYHTFRGTKREAEDRLTELMASVGKGSYVEPNKKIMVANFVRGRINQWEASGKISATVAFWRLGPQKMTIRLIGRNAAYAGLL